MADHDGGYKLLFSHAAMVADLFQGFLGRGWSEELDFSTLERVERGFLSDDLQRRESDLVWRVRWGGGEWVYLLLEMQSTVDGHMGLRMFTYVGLLFQTILREGRPAEGGLPPILPAVFYNGVGRWQAALDAGELVRETPAGLAPFRPALRYLVIDVLRFPEAALPEGNLVSAVIRLEQSRDPESFTRVILALAEILRGPEHDSLSRAFTTWITRVLLPSRAPGARIPKMASLQEVRAMLTREEEQFGIDWSRKWVRMGREEGLKEGLKKGEARGLKEGTARGRAEALRTMRRLILDQLSGRFDPLPATARRRVQAMTSLEDLAAIGRRLLTARSLTDLGLDD